MSKNFTLYTRLKALGIPCWESVSMAKYTTMQVGGPASLAAFTGAVPKL